MANWECVDCGINLTADGDGDPETCPICDKQMQPVTGVVLKNFGGAGVANLRSEPDGS